MVSTAVFWLDFTDPSAFSSSARPASSALAACCSLFAGLPDRVCFGSAVQILSWSESLTRRAVVHITQSCLGYFSPIKAEKMPKSSPTADHLVSKSIVLISGAYFIDIVHNVFHCTVVYCKQTTPLPFDISVGKRSAL